MLYIGVTDDLQRRVSEHRDKVNEGFTKRYHTDRLVCCEKTNDVHAAIQREKQLKAWRREKKNALIESVNPQWRDLSIGW